MKIYKYIKMRLYSLLYTSRHVRVKQARINNQSLLVFVNEDVGREIAALARYEYFDSKFLVSQVKEGDICFDIGANIGYYSTLMAKQAPKGEVHAFEPVPINYHILCANIHLNELKNITINQAALSSVNGEASFSQSRDGAFSSLVHIGRRPEAASIKTIVMSLDTYVAENQLRCIDILKVDVEGAEMLVIDGAIQTLTDTKKRPRLILMELHDENLQKYKTSAACIVGRLNEVGYMAHFVNSDGNLRELGSRDKKTTANVFFLIKDSPKGR